MTRFARAKGSKSSNVKTPEDSTPWEVMKDQLMKSKKENEEATKREEAEKQRVENYNKFLKDQKTQKRQASWCDFPETVPVKKGKVTSESEIKTKKQKNKVKSNFLQNSTDIVNNTSTVGIKDNKKHKSKKNSLKESNNSSVDNSATSPTNKNKVKRDKKEKKKFLKISAGANLSNDNSKSTESETLNNSHKVALFKEQEINSQVPQTENLKSRKNKKGKNMLQENTEIACSVSNPAEIQQIKKKKLKMLNGKPIRRKAIDDRSFELIINGKNIELVRFDGFPVMKKDAERLQELKINMIKKGIPKSEVQRTMKLERRRAEKALARVKREVCYNCRKGGHNLSDCPDLKSSIPGKEVAEGVCFKCGSTEHRQFECKVQRDKEFRFATCFICKESGHIARQCPDNPKGLYPNGGCCKLCGDVTHLRKDCPTVMDKKEESSIKLHTLATDNIEDIGQQTVKARVETQRKPKKIKF